MQDFPSENENITGKKRQLALVTLAMCGVAAICGVAEVMTNKVPRHDSIRSGERLIDELIESDKFDRFRSIARMEKGTFVKFVDYLSKNGLSDGKHISMEEKVMMTLQILGSGCSYATCMETFQHSGSTVSACFEEVISCICNCRDKLFQHQTSHT